MVPRLLARSDRHAGHDSSTEVEPAGAVAVGPDAAAAATGRGATWFHLAAMTVFGLTFALWIGCVVYVPEAINRDWVAFDHAADRLVAGPAASVYEDSMREEWPFLYPPYVLPLVAPLATLGRLGSYLVTAGAGLVAVGFSLRLFRTVGRCSPRQADVVRGGVLGGGVVLATAITGQFSPFYLLGVLGAWWAWSRGHAGRAGMALGVLVIKPYLAVPFVGYLLLRRERRALAGFGAVVVTALVVGLLVGSDAWGAYGESLRYMAAKERIGLTPTDKQVTVVSAVRVLLLGGGSAPWVELLWLLLALAAAVVVLRALGGSRPWIVAQAATSPTLRELGLVALFAVVASPRLYFYDALLAVPAAVAWYLARSEYVSTARHRCIGACIALATLGHATILTPFPATYLAGVAMAAWLVAEALDQHAGRQGVAAGGTTRPVPATRPSA